MPTRDLFDTRPAAVPIPSAEEMAALASGSAGLPGRLKAARLAAGMSLEQLGIYGLADVENGDLQPTHELIRQLARRTGADLGALLAELDAQLGASGLRLSEGRAMVLAAVRGEGGTCPCCSQPVKATEVALTRQLGATVRRLVRAFRGEPLVLEAPAAGLAADATLWGLALAVRDLPNTVRFKPTDDAKAFLRGELKLPRRLIVWQGQVIGQAGKVVGWDDLRVPVESVASPLELIR